jgi:glucosamine--fructose-6-phosphate aminotransferase (isomerizing)
LLAITNDASSPLGQRADVIIGIEAGAEHAVSTGSYVNTLAAATLVAEALTGAAPHRSFENAANGLENYLETWRERVDRLKDEIGLPARLYVVGRGESLAAARCGALILKEAAKWPAEAMSSSQFRHGPLELADERLTAIILAGHEPAQRARNLRLLKDIERFGGRGCWADEQPQAGFAHLPLASAEGGGRNAAEIVVLQLLSVAIAEQTDIAPGVFRHLGKVTTTE